MLNKILLIFSLTYTGCRGSGLRAARHLQGTNEYDVVWSCEGSPGPNNSCDDVSFWQCKNSQGPGPSSCEQISVACDGQGPGNNGCQKIVAACENSGPVGGPPAGPCNGNNIIEVYVCDVAGNPSTGSSCTMIAQVCDQGPPNGSYCSELDIFTCNNNQPPPPNNGPPYPGCDTVELNA